MWKWLWILLSFIIQVSSKRWLNGLSWFISHRVIDASIELFNPITIYPESDQGKLIFELLIANHLRRLNGKTIRGSPRIGRFIRQLRAKVHRDNAALFISSLWLSSSELDNQCVKKYVPKIPSPSPSPKYKTCPLFRLLNNQYFCLIKNENYQSHRNRGSKPSLQGYPIKIKSQVATSFLSQVTSSFTHGASRISKRAYPNLISLTFASSYFQ